MPSLLETLRDANQRLSGWLDKTTQTEVAPELVTLLLPELMRVGAQLRAEKNPAAGGDPVLDQELTAYRNQIERLRDLMPCLQEQLMAERARIEGQRLRVFHAAQWIEGSRQTVEK